MKAIVCCSAVLVLLLVLSSNAYVIKPAGLTIVGSADKGKRLWKPSGAVKISETIGAVRLSTSPDDCTGSSCNYVAAYTTDGGETFTVDHAAAGFCGTGGVVEGTVVRCPTSTQVKSDKEGYLALEQKRFEFVAPGLISSGRIDVSKHSSPAYFAFPNGTAAQKVRVGDDLTFFPEKALYVRNAEVQLENGTAVHVFYKSTTGDVWEFVSFIPFPLGSESAIHRLGETKLMLIAGKSGNYTQATSVFLGSRWEKIEPAQFSTPLTTFVSKYQTSIYGGLRGRPGVTAMAAAPKKGSEKPIDLTDMHNRMAHKNPQLLLSNFSTEYRNTTAFDCLSEPFSSADADGCLSSSYVALLSLVEGKVLAFYDKIKSYGLAADAGDHMVLALTLSLNETKEENEAKEKAEAQKKREEREKVAEESRRQAQKEANERRKRERREKNRKDKQRRAEFAEADQVNLDEAAAMLKEDGEFVVVRTVDVANTDIEKDTFFF